MKAAVIGCGSMGKRRVRDLLALETQVIACDSRGDRRSEVHAKLGIETVGNWEEALSTAPDLIVVSLPPFLHAKFVKAALQADRHVFSEAPLAIHIEDLQEIDSLAKASGKVVAPSCTYLHHFYHVKVKELLDLGTIGQPLGFHSHFGNHLADWHPYEGLSFYAADRKNGGMGFDVLVHQLHLVKWLLGSLDSVTCMAAKRSDLQIVSGYDTYDLLLQSRNTSVAVHCNVVQRPAMTSWSLWGEEGTIQWTWKSMEVYEKKTGTWRSIGLPAEYDHEKVYYSEMSHVLDAINGRAVYCHTLDDEKQVLTAMLGAEESAQSGKAISMKA